MSFGKIWVGGGFVFLVALLLFFDDGGFSLPLLLAVLTHEAGHITTLKLLGGSIEGLELRLGGITAVATSVSPARELTAVLAGPAAGLIAAALTLRSSYRIFAYISLFLSVYNLLPLRNLDGGRVLEILREARTRG